MDDKKRVICDLEYEGKVDEIKELAKHPDYMCFTCGRFADREENLCHPVDADTINPGSVLIE
jgi:hypothetical protein